MTYPPETVKNIIRTFVDESIDKNITLQGKSGEKTLANQSIFEIESFLVQLRNQYGINDRLDTSITSENILKNFSSIEASKAFRPVDYQYNFLHHLAAEFNPDLDLFSLIDSFVEKFKEQFSLSDIVITSTGATRCKTNIRFALNDLRNLAFVLSKNPTNKRSWGPSVIGLIVLLNARINYSEFQKCDFYKEPETLRPLSGHPSRISAIYSDDPLLLLSLKQFKESGYIYTFLTNLRDNSLEIDEKVLLNDIMQEYILFTQEGLEITSTGVKETKLFKELSELFQKKLFDIEERNPKLYAKLQAHFRNKK